MNQFVSMNIATRRKISSKALLAFIEATSHYDVSPAQVAKMSGFGSPTELHFTLTRARRGVSIVLEEWQLLRLHAVSSVLNAIRRNMHFPDDYNAWLTNISEGALRPGLPPLDILLADDDVVVIDYFEDFKSWLTMPFEHEQIAIDNFRSGMQSFVGLDISELEQMVRPRLE